MTDAYRLVEPLLQRAISEPVGLAVTSRDPQHLITTMRVAILAFQRRGITAYNDLHFAVSPLNGGIAFIYRLPNGSET